MDNLNNDNVNDNLNNNHVNNNLNNDRLNDNLNNDHIKGTLGEIASNSPQQPLEPKNITNTPPSWFNSLMNFNHINFENQTNLNLDIHLFGSTEEFNIPEGEIRPPLYRMFESIGANQRKEIVPLSNKVKIVISYYNENNQLVKLMLRESAAGSKFTILERHTVTSKNKELITCTLVQFNNFLSENQFVGYTSINSNNNYL